jgi:hypothetical protein
MQGDKEAGEMRSSADGIGLALLRIDALERLGQEGAALTANGATLSPLRPPWLAAPAANEAGDSGPPGADS